MTRQAASCWYKAWVNSYLTVSRCYLSWNYSSSKASHSFYMSDNNCGTDVAVRGRGLYTGCTLMWIKSSKHIGLPVIGHVDVDSTCFSINLFSNIWPLNLEATGVSIYSPEREQVDHYYINIFKISFEFVWGWGKNNNIFYTKGFYLYILYFTILSHFNKLNMVITSFLWLP